MWVTAKTRSVTAALLVRLDGYDLERHACVIEIQAIYMV
jgi:hypothetical protein